MMCGCCMPRRGFLGALAGAGVAAASGPAGAASSPARNIVDVHAHFTPPEIKAANMQGLGPMGGWTVEAHIEAMDRAGVSRSLLSMTSPGVTVGGDRGHALTRSSNEYAARLVSERKGRLGFFVYVQLNDVEASLKEIEYGLDVLKGAGVGLFTSYGGKWLGDPLFDPVFAELERRRAVAYVHPVAAPCCQGLVPNVADAMIEFGTDTTRAITSYIYRGAARRYPNVKMIWSHSGGTMPYLIERFDNADKIEPFKTVAPEGYRAAATRFFYDVAQSANPVTSSALRQVIPPSQIVFGTDYPFRTPAEHVAALEGGRVYSRAELAGIYRGNVARSLPSLLA